MLSFKNCNIYINNKKIIKSSLTIKNGKFDSFISAKDAIHLDNKYIIVPGFIEQHMHGSMGCDTMDCKSSSLHTISKALVIDGVTSWLPTTMTMPKNIICKAVKKVADFKHHNDEAKIEGINLEGPFISASHKGAQDDKYIVLPNVKDLNKFVKASNNKIRIITIAVEKANKEFYDYCKKHNIVVSVGHTDANEADIKKAISLGLNCSTHTFNAMNKQITKGNIVYGICKSNIYREVICDLFHLTKEQYKYLFKNKLNKIIIVSDSMEARYMPDGVYSLGSHKVYVKNGKALMAEGTKAGSILRLPQGLKNVKEICKISIEKTIDMVAKNPASNLHLDKIGCIKLGNWADFVVIDKNFNIYQTYVNGKLVYNRLK